VLWDITRRCILVCPEAWAACPDIVQARRYNKEIETMLAGWKDENGKYLVRGIFDGGFLSKEVTQRYGWVTPFRSDAIARELEEPRRKWMEYVNTFLSLVRGPGAEGRFGDEVHKFGVLRKPWRLEPELHTVVLQLAEALLNIERREQRQEVLDYTHEEAESSCFLLYLPTTMDDLLKSEGESVSLDPFRFCGEEDIPASIAGLFDNAETYLSAMATPVARTVQSKRKKNEEREEKDKEKKKSKEKEKEKGKVSRPPIQNPAKRRRQTQQVEKESPFTFEG
jgi:hypothetical protein